VIAEQSAASVFLLTGDKPAVNIEMTLRMKVTKRSQRDACVLSKVGSYEPKFSEPLQSALHQAFWEGVEEGLLVAEEGLPDCIMEIDLARLVIIQPHLEPIPDSEDRRRLADILTSLISGTVASLWQSLKVIQ
jgi:hypothetical protein